MITKHHATALFIACALIFAIFTPLSARADMGISYKLGVFDYLIPITPTDVKDSNGQPLTLGYRLSIDYVMLGISIKDQGYVMIRQGDGNQYQEVPKGFELRKYQILGVLPDPLPPYHISYNYYFEGWFMWIVFAGFLLSWMGKRLLFPARGY